MNHQKTEGKNSQRKRRETLLFQPSKWKSNQPFLFNEVDPFNQKIAIALYHNKHIQHVLFLDHVLNL